MNWNDISALIGKSAPILGTLIGGPAGAAVGALIASGLGVGNTPDEVSVALQTNPDAAVKLKQIEKERQVELQGLAVQHAGNVLAAETAQVQAVNQTMQVEAKSEKWPTYSWRPFCGFVFGISFFGVYFVLPLLKLPVPSIPFEAWAALGAVLGVASWFRGKAQADPLNSIPATRG
jgi:hypothetical protein